MIGVAFILGVVSVTISVTITIVGGGNVSISRFVVVSGTMVVVVWVVVVLTLFHLYKSHLAAISKCGKLKTCVTNETYDHPK